MRFHSLLILFLISLAMQLAVAGTFLTPQVYATARSSSTIAVGDLNHDGHLDVVTGNISKSISVLLNQGDGTLLPHVDYSTSYAVFALSLADLNHDGAVDIIVDTARLGAARNLIGVFLGNGDGTFQPEQTFADCDSNVTSLAVGDFNADGNPDLAVAHTDSSAILLGKGDGTFNSSVCIDMPVSEILAVDLNRDGKIDLIGANYSNRHRFGLVVELGNGDGTFQAARNFDLKVALYDLHVADVNHDGILDAVAIGFGNTTQVSVFLGSGDGGFRPPINAQLPAIPSRLVLGRFDADANLDLVFQGKTGITFLAGNGDGTFVDSGRTYLMHATQLAAADLNADGHADVVGLSEYGTQVLVVPGKGDGTFDSPRSFLANLSLNSALRVGYADFNGDGLSDLALCTTGSEVDVLIRNADGTFQPPISTTVGSSNLGGAVGDFNADGKMDIAVAAYGEGRMYILLGNGNGTFQPPVPIPMHFHPQLPAARDVNGDGKVDLIVPNGFADSRGLIAVLLGNGDGTFQPAIKTVVGPRIGSMNVADFNHDNKIDVAVGTSTKARVLLGNGDGTFQAPIRLKARGTFVFLRAVDLNGDGNVDVATSSTDVTVFLGNGDGTFQPPMTGAKGVTNGIFADFNGDGKIDLIGGSELQDGSLGVAFGNGDGTFPSVSSYYTGGVFDCLAADVNGDGPPDVIALGYGAVYVLLNTTVRSHGTRTPGLP